MRNREGFSLAELIVGLVVASLVSASLVQLMVTQSRFMTTQEGRNNARHVSRSATNLLMSELRMVEPAGGVVAATADSVTFLLPFASGLVCGNSGSHTYLMLAPYDTMAFRQGAQNFQGYGWRDANGVLTYVQSGVSASITSSWSGTYQSTCETTAGFTKIPNALGARVSPQIAGSFAGAAIFLHQKITYRFANSVSVPGSRALYRRAWAQSRYEELVAPFDNTARFRFFWTGDTDARDAAPASMADLEGVELFLVGMNERAATVTDAERTPLRTAVFFRN